MMKFLCRTSASHDREIIDIPARQGLSHRRDITGTGSPRVTLQGHIRSPTSPTVQESSARVTLLEVEILTVSNTETFLFNGPIRMIIQEGIISHPILIKLTFHSYQPIRIKVTSHHYCLSPTRCQEVNSLMVTEVTSHQPIRIEDIKIENKSLEAR